MKYWPLLDLQLELGEVSMRVPAEAELATLAQVAADGVHRSGERPFLTPWAEAGPTDRAQFILQQHWRHLGNWHPDNWQLDLGIFVAGQPVGAMTLRATGFAVIREISSTSWVGLTHQGKGIATAARITALSFVFDHLGANTVRSDVFPDNHASQRVLRKLGYEADGVSYYRRDDQVLVSDRLRLDRQTWQQQTHPPLTVRGLGPCMPMFGL